MGFFSPGEGVVFVMGTRKQLRRRCQIDGLVVVRWALVLVLLRVEGVEPVDVVCVAIDVAVAEVAVVVVDMIGG